MKKKRSKISLEKTIDNAIEQSYQMGWKVGYHNGRVSALKEFIVDMERMRKEVRK